MLSRHRHSAARRWGARSVSLAFIVAATTTLVGQRSTPLGPSAPPPDIAARFRSRAAEPLTSYRARRHLEAHNPRFGKDGWMDVMTELRPDRSFAYSVIAQGGSDIVRTRVFDAALEAERDLLRDAKAAALDETNYQFQPAGEERGYAKIALIPKRKDRFLINGWMFVTPADADLREVRGRMTKSPSFWTSQVDVVRRYERVCGHRVPIETQSTAAVFLGGTSTFVMRYDYLMVNGVVVTRDRCQP